MQSATGLFLFDAIEWSPLDADLVIYCDTSLTGLGFYCPSLNITYYADTSHIVPTHTIFYYESLSILSALAWAHDLTHSPHRLMIYMDSMNTVKMFSSLKAQQGYNELLMLAVGLMIPSEISLHVFHIAGTKNAIADALS